MPSVNVDNIVPGNLVMHSHPSSDITGLSVPAGANPTASLGLSAINGSATTFMRSDAAPALDVTAVDARYLKLDGTNKLAVDVLHTNLYDLTIPATGTAALATGIAGGQILIGGSAVTDILKLQGTSGTGTLTVPAIQALVGTNGATTALTVLNNGNVGIGTTGPNSKLQVAGAIAVPLVNKTAAYTITASDSIITCNATTAAFTVTLPTAVGITGRQYTIKKIDSSINAITVDGNGAETIDGAATYSLVTQYKYISIVSDGANWIIVTNN